MLVELIMPKKAKPVVVEKVEEAVREDKSEKFTKFDKSEII